MPNGRKNRLGLRLAGGILSAAAVVLGALGPASSARAGDGEGQPVTVTVPEHTTPPVTEAALTCTGGTTRHPGDQLSCTGTGFDAAERVSVSLGAGRDLGSATADENGTAKRDLSLPTGLGAGAKTLTFTGATSGRSATFDFTVTIVADVPVGGGGGSLAKTGAGVAGIAGAGAILVGIGAAMKRIGRRRAAVRG